MIQLAARLEFPETYPRCPGSRGATSARIKCSRSMTNWCAMHRPRKWYSASRSPIANCRAGQRQWKRLLRGSEQPPRPRNPAAALMSNGQILTHDLSSSTMATRNVHQWIERRARFTARMDSGNWQTKRNTRARLPSAEVHSKRPAYLGEARLHVSNRGRL